MAEELDIASLRYSADPAVVRAYREGYMRAVQDRDWHAVRRVTQDLAQLIRDIRPELRELWKQYPSATHIGVRFDEKVAIVGKSVDEVRCAARSMFGDELPLDYIAKPKPLMQLHAVVSQAYQ